MQITNAEVTPVEIKIRKPVRMAGIAEFSHVMAVFVRLVTAASHQPDHTGPS